MEKLIEDDNRQSSTSINRVERIYKNLVFSAISELQKGKLKILLPEGEQVIFGKEEVANAPVLQIKDYAFFRKCVLYGDIGFAESYMDGDWSTNDLVGVMSWFLLNHESAPTLSGSQKKSAWKMNFLNKINRVFHRLRDNSLVGSRKNISYHYDLGNDFYKLFLDETMTYSSARFISEEQSLQEGQIQKYKSLALLARIEDGQDILEIGTGWGSFAIYLAENYNCQITTITISKEQFSYAQQAIKQKGLQDRITVKLEDYRKITGQYDRIVSIEMLEAVGDKYYEAFFQKCHEVLKKDGLLAMQVITCPDSRFDSIRKGVDFIQKYIFPGSLIPSIGRINQAINRTGDLSLFELSDMGLSYAKTLRIWREHFELRLTDVRKQGYDEKFIKMWRYYLAYCEVAFQMCNLSVVQAVYSRPNNTSFIH